MGSIRPYRVLVWDAEWRVWQRVARYVRLADALDAYGEVATAPGHLWAAVVLVEDGRARILRHNVPADLPPDLFRSEAATE